ncbi:MAG: Permease for cytosine/purines uracil thiamine allantoin [Acidimicrobiales bacterium]|nr:Permease for cytosine/purines uracil thiamine allantoin [Acidimicrobiales bacterium]
MAIEPPITLDEAPARALGRSDQLALWGNLGISLLLPVTATFLLAPGMSLGACLVAIVVGTVLGNVLLGLSAIPGADTGAPAMVLFRGLFGRRGSYVPTALNLLQCLGWSTFEIVIIAESADRVVGGGWRWPFVLAGGVVATLMAIRPLAVVIALRRYIVWLVIGSTIYLFVQVLRSDLPPLGHGGWNGFWPAADLVAALSVSWMPLAADYSRQSRTAADAFWGAAVGYGVSSAAFFALGVLAIAGMGGNDVIASLLGIPAGALALLVLAVDEVDEAFANIYSTAVSVQNVAPRVDRRLLAVAVGTFATVLALAVNIHEYESFLLLIGSVFVPLFAVFIVEYYLLRRRRWDVSDDAPGRWLLLLPWLGGFVTYQLVNPGSVGWWMRWWVARRDDLAITPPSWLGATISSFLVAAALTLLVGRLTTADTSDK